MRQIISVCERIQRRFDGENDPQRKEANARVESCSQVREAAHLHKLQVGWERGVANQGFGESGLRVPLCLIQVVLHSDNLEIMSAESLDEPFPGPARHAELHVGPGRKSSHLLSQIATITPILGLVFVQAVDEEAKTVWTGSTACDTDRRVKRTEKL